MNILLKIIIIVALTVLFMADKVKDFRDKIKLHQLKDTNNDSEDDYSSGLVEYDELNNDSDNSIGSMFGFMGFIFMIVLVLSAS